MDVKYKRATAGVGAVVFVLLGMIAWTAYRPTPERVRGEITATASGDTDPVVDTTATPAAKAAPSVRAPTTAASGAAFPAQPAAADGTCAHTLCRGECVDTNEDSRNCGGCGNACPDPQWCDRGHCRQSKCNARAGETECSGTCKNLMNDPQNCGECGAACEPGQTCKDMQCDPPRVHVPAPFVIDGGRIFVVDGGRILPVPMPPPGAP